MTIRPRGKSFLVDVKVSAADNPTRLPVRTRVTVADMPAARQLEVEIRAVVMKFGAWSPQEEIKPHQISGTLAAALEEAWSYSGGRKRGWKFQKSGEEQFTKARDCVDILGHSTLCNSITSRELDKLTDTFTKRGATSGTIRSKVQAFYRVLYHAQRRGWITHRPLWERPEASAPRDFIFTTSVQAAVMNHFEPDMRALFVLGIETGLRLGELIDAQCADWSLEDRTVGVRAHMSKSNFQRVVTLTDLAVDTIRPYLKADPSARPFGQFTRQEVGTRMREARDALGYSHEKDFCFHATRHTRATRLARQTKDPFLVMSQLGHSNVNISMRYIKLAAVSLSAPSLPNPDLK